MFKCIWFTETYIIPIFLISGDNAFRYNYMSDPLLLMVNMNDRDADWNEKKAHGIMEKHVFIAILNGNCWLMFLARNVRNIGLWGFNLFMWESVSIIMDVLIKKNYAKVLSFVIAQFQYHNKEYIFTDAQYY